VSFNQLDEVEGAARGTADGWWLVTEEHGDERTASHHAVTDIQHRKHWWTLKSPPKRSAADAATEFRDRRQRRLPLCRGELVNPLHHDRIGPNVIRNQSATVEGGRQTIFISVDINYVIRYWTGIKIKILTPESYVLLVTVWVTGDPDWKIKTIFTCLW